MGKQLPPPPIFDEEVSSSSAIPPPPIFDEEETVFVDRVPKSLSPDEWSKTITSYRDALKKYEESVKGKYEPLKVQTDGGARSDNNLSPIERQAKIALS